MRMAFKWSTDRLQKKGLAVALAVFSAMPALAPRMAAAAPSSKVAQALTNAAQKEFDAGNFERAGDLFLQIWQHDKSQMAALYNAARAFHLGGKLDAADDLYRELLGSGRLDEAQAAKVKGFQTELQGRRANAKADEAGRAETAGNYSLAAQLWADAGRLAPKKYAWMLRGARAEQLAGHADAALKGYERVLAEAPTDAPERKDALRWRLELKPIAGSAAQEPTKRALGIEANASKPESNSESQAQTKGSPVAGYVTLTAGVLSLIAGGVILGMARSADGDLQAKFAQKDSQGKVNGIAQVDGYTEANRIESKYQVGWIAAGAGVVGAAVGTWLVVRSRDGKVAVGPDGSGARMVVRF
jgi:tetratricopeptide (TPR) repeat protein